MPYSSDLYVMPITNSPEHVRLSKKYFELPSTGGNSTSLAKYKEWFGEKYIIIGTQHGYLFFLELSTKSIPKKIKVSRQAIISCAIVNAGENAIVVAVTAPHLYCYLEDSRQRYDQELSYKLKTLLVVGRYVLMQYDNDACQLINIYKNVAKFQPSLRQEYSPCEQLLSAIHHISPFVRRTIWKSGCLEKSSLQFLAGNSLLKDLNRKVIISKLNRMSGDPNDIKSEIFFRNLFQS